VRGVVDTIVKEADGLRPIVKLSDTRCRIVGRPDIVPEGLSHAGSAGDALSPHGQRSLRAPASVTNHPPRRAHLVRNRSRLRARIERLSASLAVPHCTISSSERPQPMQTLSSSRQQLRTHGESSGSGSGVLMRSAIIREADGAACDRPPWRAGVPRLPEQIAATAMDELFGA
jgi:hypothetical protein